MPYLYIPIETKVREFQAKLLLSCYAAEKGFSVILGEEVEMLHRIRHMPRGYYIGNSVAKANIKGAELMRSIGNRFIAWCEEGLVIHRPEAYARDRISRRVFSRLDLFFAWGKAQAEAVRIKVPDAADKIILAGNPRLDLLRPPFRSLVEAEARKIREVHGPYILINTNFSRYNHFYSRDFFIQNLKAMGRIRNKEEAAFMEGWISYSEKMFHHFTSMVKRLSKAFPDMTVIVRPHPAENRQTWGREMHGLPNVKIIHQGGAVPWISGAEVMIHNNCTTGVEAFVLGAPVICYCPETSDEYDAALPNAISEKACSEDELIDKVKQVMKNPESYVENIHHRPEVTVMIEKYISGLNGGGACEIIVKTLEELNRKHRLFQNGNARMPFRTPWRKIEDATMTSKRMVRRIIKGDQAGYSYHKHKFPGLSADEVETGVKAFQHASGRFSDISVQRIPGTRSCHFIASKAG